MNRPHLPMHLEVLVPAATLWIARQEARILREGRPLNDLEIRDARIVGLKHPERVRVLAVDRVPALGGPVLQRTASRLGLAAGDAAGMAMRYGIFVRRDLPDIRWVLAHELAHTFQYERMGGIMPFLRAYVADIIANGYRDARMEWEADDIADRVARSRP